MGREGVWRVPPLRGRGGVPRFGRYLLALGEGCLRGRSLFVAQEGRAGVGFPQWRISIGPISLDYGLLVDMSSEKAS